MPWCLILFRCKTYFFRPPLLLSPALPVFGAGSAAADLKLPAPAGAAEVAATAVSAAAAAAAAAASFSVRQKKWHTSTVRETCNATAVSCNRHFNT